MAELITNFDNRYFHFEHPQYLWLLIVPFILIFLYLLLGRKFQFSLKKLRNFIDEHLLKHLLMEKDDKKKSRIKNLSYFLIFILLILALANPRWDFTEVESFKPNVNIIFAVDLSRSMDARDEKPSRIERVQQEISDILDNLSGVNFGIIGFANQTHVISPITDDKNALEYMKDTISTDLISIQGSNIEAALSSANLLLKPVKDGINYIILMTDGDFGQKISPSLKNKYQDVQIIPYAFGSTEGAPIPQPQGGFLKYGGKMVITKLDNQNLLNLASKPQYYIKSSYLDDDIEKLKSIIESGKKVEEAKFTSMRVWHDRFYIPLALALLISVFFFKRGSSFPAIIITLICLSFPATIKANSETKNSEQNQDELNLEFLKLDKLFNSIKSGDIFKNQDQMAVKHLDNKAFDKAIENFSSPYNKGVAAFRKKDYQKAEEFFKQQNDLKSTYNLANAQLKQLKLEEAIKSYEKVLAENPNHINAKHNLEIAKKLLEKQQQQQKKNQNQRQNQKDKQQNQQQDNQQQQQQNNSDSDNNKQQQNRKNESDKKSD